MIPLDAQLAFLQEIQQAFERGYNQHKVTTVLLGFVLVAAPILAAFWVWRNWPMLSFHLRRFYGQHREKEYRLAVAKYLRKRRVPVEVFLIGRKTNKLLCKADVSAHGGGRCRLGLLDRLPSSWRRALIGRKVMVLTKPFRMQGERLNGFATYLKSVRIRAGEITEITVLTPDVYTYAPRRRFPRKRVARPGAVRFRVWGQAKRNSFMITVPDFESGDAGPEAGAKKGSRVVNISQGGLLLLVRPKSEEQQVRQNEELILELMVLDPANRRFEEFLLKGMVRSVSRTPEGAWGLGVEFVAQGERTASRQVEWRSVADGVEGIHRLLTAMARRTHPSG